MPRPLVYGNGSMLLQLDRNGDIRDFFWPTVGLLNHLQGYKIRMGVWVDGSFAWLESDGWERRQGYRPEALIGDSTYTHQGLGVSLHVEEAAYPDNLTINVWVRRVTVTALREGMKEVRLFFNHDLRIAESDIGDTAFYHPFSDSVIHYKREFAFLFGGRGDNGGLFEYTTGIKAFKEFHGTLWDVHDGHLEKVPINQGSVDSTLSLAGSLESGKVSLDYWLFCKDSVDAVVELAARVTSDLSPDAIFAEVEQDARSYDYIGKELSEPLRDFYRKSIRIMETQCDWGGGITAANDSDILETNRATYSYVWPRDGALVSLVAGWSIWFGDQFIQSYCPLIFEKYVDRQYVNTLADRPFFIHKYDANGQLGASWHPWIYDGKPEVPYQQDQSALTVLASVLHWESRHGTMSLAPGLSPTGLYWEGGPTDPDKERRFEGGCQKEFFDKTYRQLVTHLAGFLASNVDPNGLPLPSWDLWEERRGIHCYTVVTTIAALHKAADWATEREERENSETWRAAAVKMQTAFLQHFWNEEESRLCRMLQPDYTPDTTADSATLSAIHYGIINPKSKEAKQLVDFIADKLELKGGIGGVARYEHDYYFRRSEAYPGNPWVICTMWLAQARLQMGDIQAAEDALQWVMDRAEPTGVLAEQYHPETGEPLSVSPLTWSHAEFCRTVQWLQEAKQHAR